MPYVRFLFDWHSCVWTQRCETGHAAFPRRGTGDGGYPSAMTDTRPLVLITGASGGIGHQLARQFACHGYDLVVNAEDEALESAAQGLRESGAEVRAVRADLQTNEGRFRLLDALDGLTVDVAVLNAGVGRGGAFVDTDLTDDQEVIDLNVTATVRLAKPLLRAMVARGGGRLAFTRPSPRRCPVPSNLSTTPPRRSCSPSPRHSRRR